MSLKQSKASDTRYKGNMRRRIFYAILVAFLVAMVFTATIAIVVSYGEYEERLNEDLNIDLNILSAIDDIDKIDLGNITLSDRRITLIAPDGSVIFDSAATERMLENHLDRKEVKDAFSSGAGFDSRSSSTIGIKYIYQAILLPSGNVLRVSAPANTVTYFVMSVLFPLSICLFLLTILSLFISSFVSRVVTKPLNDLDLDNPENVSGYPELTPLLVRISKQQSIIKAQVSEERRRTEEFVLITDNMKEGLVVIDKAGKILSLNNATRHLFNNSRISLGDNILQLSRNVPFTTLINDVISGSSNTIHLEQNGKLLEIIASPVVHNEKTAGGVLIFIDITEKEKREAMRKEFTANVSHELKTPLTVISGFAEILKDNELISEYVKEYANDIYIQVQRLISLVHDIIKLSELDEKSSSKEEELEEVHLSEIVKGSIDALKPKAANLSIEINMHIINESSMTGNASLLSEMVFNLLDNAIRYNKENGKIDIVIRTEGNTLLFSISDSGIGIPDEDKDRVFERFYRVDKGRSRDSGGTGLGLSIVKHSAEYHNATISLESKLGVGTKITVAFPL